jgi:hypothetical protein
MANRSYLYSLSNRPESYADRPESISGLSEWAYAVPFSYRVLMSGEPRLCASLIADGLEDDEPDRRTRLHAISAEFEPGYARLARFLAAVRSVSGTAAELRAAADETPRFLDAHRDRFLLLETIELDIMSESEEDALTAAVEEEVDRCRAAGAAVDALPADPGAAGALLAEAAKNKAAAPFNVFHGLSLDDGFDSRGGGPAHHPLGLSWWTEVLYFDLWNKAEFDAKA